MDLELAHELLYKGSSVNTLAVTRAVDNEDIEVVNLLAEALRPDGEVDEGLAHRLSMMSAQAEIARTRASASGDIAAAARQQRRYEVLADLAERFGSGRRTSP